MTKSTNGSSSRGRAGNLAYFNHGAQKDARTSTRDLGMGHVVIPGPLAMAKGDPPMATALSSGARGLGAEILESQ